MRDVDVYRSAKLLIEQHGADPLIEAALKVRAQRTAAPQGPCFVAGKVRRVAGRECVLQ